MATLADLKARVITEMVRDDLEGDLASQLSLAISRAIEFYQGHRFWFNFGSASVTTTTAEVAMPATMRVIDYITNSDGTVLDKFQFTDLVGLSCTGTPDRYAEFGDGVYVYPTPSGSVSLTFYGVKYIAPPIEDSDSTVWTNQAYDLIAARTRFLLFRDVFRDIEAAQIAGTAVNEALDRLDEETKRRNDTPLRLPADFPTYSFRALY